MGPGAGLSVPGGELRLVEDVPAAFAEIVSKQVRSTISAGEQRLFRLVLSGGATARSCYEQLAARPDVDWAHLECLVGDERCVPADDHDANQRMIKETLIDVVSPKPRFVPMNCEAPLEAYEQVIDEQPRLDLVHLGLGPDGHTASLFPNSAALEAPADRLVEHNVDPAGANPYLRLTLTLAGIARARLVVFTVAGADKREAMTRVLRNEDLPATRVRAEHVVWLCDREATGSGGLGLG